MIIRSNRGKLDPLVRRIGNRVFQGRRHRKIQIHVPGRNRSQEPFRIEISELIAFHHGDQRLVDQRFELWIVLADNQPVRLGAEAIVDNAPVVRIRAVGDQADEQNVVHDECLAAACRQREK